ncbi:MAG: DUF1638 domain-containing protein [Chloroflexi bacterium]|nr:DUF1638 domain-containing protein [Chloroflexota bacterium]
MSRFLCIACEIFARPIYLSAATSPHVIDVDLIPRGLHDQPEELKTTLQQRIDLAEGKGYEAILLGYGLCGNGTAGLQTRSVKVVIPRVHDCIGLLLGSRKRYREQFEKNPGTYWYSQDFVERSDPDNKFAFMGPISNQELARQYDAFVVKFGRENADYLMEVMGTWKSHYQRAIWIDSGINDDENLTKNIETDAGKRGWSFEKLAGDLILFRKMLNGDWVSFEDPDLVVVPINHALEPTYDERIFRCGSI